MRRWGTMLALLVAALTMTATAAALPRDTTVRTIQDRDGDNLLEFAPGEDHCVFTFTVAPSNPDCEAGRLTNERPDSILNFLQLSDFQVVDEESPARVEAVDTTQRVPGLNPFSAAYRPQESTTTQITEAMVRQARNTTSPITGARLDLSILTGDNADSQQYNETRWFIDILDGTTGPENPDPEMDDEDPTDEDPGNEHDNKIVPDSGVEALATACPGYVPNDSRYDGVRNSGESPGQDAGYYEPDGERDGDGYMPDRERNVAEVPGPHADVTVRDFPGLFEDAQRPFEAVGLGMPWYTAFGNHDALVQGNSSDAFVGPEGFDPSPTATENLNTTFDGIARGCVKPTKLPTGVLPEAFVADPLAYASNPEAETMIVPPDPRRCFLAKDLPNTALTPCSSGGWIQQHSRTAGFPKGHGFEPFAVEGQAGEGRPQTAQDAHDGYYSFVPREGVRFIVLDTITDECGPPICSEGSVDHAQFTWLEQEISDAAEAGQYVLVFSHHTLRTTRMVSTDLTEYPLHFGEDVEPEGGPPIGAISDTLEDLYCRHENVLAHVAGHEHANDLRAHRCEGSTGANPFMEISTAAHIDWPQQSRTIELLDDDGTVSLGLTILDHDGPPNPGKASGEQPLKLASIGREIAYNDYQASRGSDGKPNAQGSREDRNVIIATDKPWPPPQPAP